MTDVEIAQLPEMMSGVFDRPMQRRFQASWIHKLIMVYTIACLCCGRSESWTPTLRMWRQGTKLASATEKVACAAQTVFSQGSEAPHIGLVTERSTCNDEGKMRDTVAAIKSAARGNQLDLVSVRVSRPEDIELGIFQDRVVRLSKELVSLSRTHGFIVVVSSEWAEAAAISGAHGVHVKESHRPRIPEIREMFASTPVIGTSAHSVESALEAWDLYHPDYYFVGTCYETLSHPEKLPEDLEGPALPGQVVLALGRREESANRPPVLAIGGIDDTNCHEPVNYGADGIATIRAVLCCADPGEMVARLVSAMVASDGS